MKTNVKLLIKHIVALLLVFLICLSVVIPGASVTVYAEEEDAVIESLVEETIAVETESIEEEYDTSDEVSDEQTDADNFEVGSSRYSLAKAPAVSEAQVQSGEQSENEKESESESETTAPVKKGLSQEDGKWYYYLDDGTLFKGGLKSLQSDGTQKYYYFQEDGSAFTGGFKTVEVDKNRKYYYFQQDGTAFTGGYKEFDFNGRKYYSYFNSDGTAFTDGYKQISISGNNYSFYFMASGTAYTDGYKTVSIDGKTYYYFFGKDGRAVTNVLESVKYAKKTLYYYFKEDGKAFSEGYKEIKSGNTTDYYYFLATGSAYYSGYKTANIDGKTCYFYFNSDGKAVKNALKSVAFGKITNYYYFGDNGRAFTGGLKDVAGTKYYFGSNGQAIKDTYKKIDGTTYYFEKDGKQWNGKVYTIMLDPGHDSEHPGASYNGVKEEEPNMKITLAMKAELEKYKGVVVYLTHDTLECTYDEKNAGEWDEKSELAFRVTQAYNVGADYMISLHNDITADSWTATSGLLMLYPNANYRKYLQTEAIALGETIVAEHKAIGRNYRGQYILDIDDGRTYPDGSKADYYSILRNAKLRDIPAIIIEHAILNNRTDNALLKNDSELNKLGVADATGVAKYLKLEKR